LRVWGHTVMGPFAICRYLPESVHFESICLIPVLFALYISCDPESICWNSRSAFTCTSFALWPWICLLEFLFALWPWICSPYNSFILWPWVCLPNNCKNWFIYRGCLFLIGTWSHLQYIWGSMLAHLFLWSVITTCVSSLITLWYLGHFMYRNG
jgi:hypothetical protein